MAHVLTISAQLQCPHGGTVQLSTGCSGFIVDGKPVLITADVVGKMIAGCTTPASTGPPPTKPCTTVVSLLAGESSLLFADGMGVLTTNALGLTDGLSGGSVKWGVSSSGSTKLEVP